MIQPENGNHHEALPHCEGSGLDKQQLLGRIRNSF
jgi:hypothetical protein